MKIIKDLRTLNAIAKKYRLNFSKTHKYYLGRAHKKGESLPYSFEHNNKKYELKYFDGCFNPFLVTKTN